ncbi:MAG TPA: UTP--glucose-1-phosphate uridylyltransferase [Burkholderiales bacterium]|jgi:UTP--glucose-1-phosphate uridylyltransferase|nr:UTP--glucose-1-phosphate uridylyltransferase [Burkholderiales bacterium]
MKKILKAVFPLAPSLSSPGPMAMTRLSDRPLIQYAIEEALSAGIAEMIFVSGPERRRANGEGDTDEHPEVGLARELIGNSGLLEAIRALVPQHVKFAMARQLEPRGLGHAVLCARPLVGDDCFAVILPETLVDSRPAVLAHMTAQYDSYHCSFVAAQPAHPSERGRLCYARCGAQLGGIAQVTGITDDPRPAEGVAPLEIIGRFLLTPRIFTHLEALAADPQQAEIRLTDALSRLAGEQTVLADCIDGVSFDCTTRAGYLKAMVAAGLAHPEAGTGLAHQLQRLVAARAAACS